MNRTKHQLIIALTILSLLPLAACGPVSDLANPKSYQDDLVAFRYPGNWRITEATPKNYGMDIAVAGPRNAVVLLTVCSPDWDLDLAKFAEVYERELPNSIPVGKIIDSRGGEITKTADGVEEAEVQFTYAFLNKRILTTAEFWKMDLGGTKVLGVAQVSDRDRPKLAEGIAFLRQSIALPRDEDVGR